MYVSSLPFICHLYSFGFSFLHLTDQIIQLLNVKWKVGLRCGDVMQPCTLAAWNDLGAISGNGSYTQTQTYI